MAEYRDEGEDRIVRRLTRALQIFLYREERLVWGPTLRSKRQVREMVLDSDEVQEIVRALAAERNSAESRRWRRRPAAISTRSPRISMAYYFAILAFFFHRIWHRMFSGLESGDWIGWSRR